MRLPRIRPICPPTARRLCPILSGPARVIAPAGSGKTRVLTERLRHLLADRGWERETVLAVAYIKEAQLELERRTADIRPRAAFDLSTGFHYIAPCVEGSAVTTHAGPTRRTQ